MEDLRQTKWQCCLGVLPNPMGGHWCGMCFGLSAAILSMLIDIGQWTVDSGKGKMTVDSGHQTSDIGHRTSDWRMDNE